MSDMRDKQSEFKSLLKKKIEENSLTDREKELIRIAMEFGYALAYCSRTCDMNESFYAAGRYDDDYKIILGMIK